MGNEWSMSSPPLPHSANPTTEGWRRILILLSVAAGMAYPLLDSRFGDPADIVLKGLGVGALALAALAAPRAPWLAAIMALGALGDVLLELPGLFVAGGAAFAAGHGVGITFYLRHRRIAPTIAARVAAVALIGYGFAMPALVLPAGMPNGALTLYSVLLCGMAAAALLSGFPRRLATVGALLFVASDTLLVMRLGGRLLGGAELHCLMVWYAYYLGQLLIFLGISQGARDV